MKMLTQMGVETDVERSRWCSAPVVVVGAGSCKIEFHITVAAANTKYTIQNTKYLRNTSADALRF